MSLAVHGALRAKDWIDSAPGSAVAKALSADGPGPMTAINYKSPIVFYGHTQQEHANILKGPQPLWPYGETGKMHTLMRDKNLLTETCLLLVLHPEGAQQAPCRIWNGLRDTLARDVREARVHFLPPPAAPSGLSVWCPDAAWLHTCLSIWMPYRSTGPAQDFKLVLQQEPPEFLFRVA